jgi:hypothetical protein
MSKKMKKQLDSSEKETVSADGNKIDPITVKYNDGVFQIDENYKKAFNCFGIENNAMCKLMLHQIISSSTQNSETIASGSIAMYLALEPRDSIEQLLIGQMIATHNMAMEMSSRAIIPEQTFEGVDANVNRVTKLMRTFTAQVDTLKKYRTGGKQTIQVQHVNVNEGGQAVVGSVNTK